LRRASQKKVPKRIEIQHGDGRDSVTGNAIIETMGTMKERRMFGKAAHHPCKSF